MAKPSILVTRRLPKEIEDRIAARYDATFNTTDTQLNSDELRSALTRFDAILPTVTDQMNAAVFDVDMPKTKVLANYGVGHAHIDEQGARALNLTVTNTPDVLSECTADIAVTLLLMAARRAGEGERELRAGQWTGWRPTHLMGTKVSGKTLGIIGFGRIGQEMARRAHFGFGMNILVHNRSKIDQSVLTRFNAKQATSLDELLPLCDFVSLHCPGGAENKHLIDSRRLDLMKPDAFLLNTARGEVVNEHALIQALSFGTIGGAGLDVFDGEPKVAPALLECDNLVALPHLGSATRETRLAMGERVLENLCDFFDGKDPRDRVY